MRRQAKERSSDLTIDLAEENRRLRDQIAALEAQVAFLTQHRTMASGMQGERPISGHTRAVFNGDHEPSGGFLAIRKSEGRK